MSNDAELEDKFWKALKSDMTVMLSLNAAEESDCAFAERCAEDRRHLAAIRANRESAAAEYFAEEDGATPEPSLPSTAITVRAAGRAMQGGPAT